jgi:hypothetical protein
MAEYRAYAIGADDHIVKSAPLICKDDSEAIAEAKKRFAGFAIEIWSGDRLVTRLDPDGQQRPL